VFSLDLGLRLGDDHSVAHTARADPEVVAAMVDPAPRGDDVLARLTPRQGEVIALVAEGRTNAAIARRLGITEKAVVQHVSRIYDLLGLTANDEDHRRVLAVVRYLGRDG
jgi:DNA-binding NarL/FixJ family response regulator